MKELNIYSFAVAQAMPISLTYSKIQSATFMFSKGFESLIFMGAITRKWWLCKGASITFHFCSVFGSESSHLSYLLWDHACCLLKGPNQTQTANMESKVHVCSKGYWVILGESHFPALSIILWARPLCCCAMETGIAVLPRRYKSLSFWTAIKSDWLKIRKEPHIDMPG